MVKAIEISPPRKCSGLSSFLLSFEWNPTLTDLVKSLPT